jgi:glycosyltransferase involved in cell wall biosynthesis
MVDRVMSEYELAGRVRVYTEWGKKSMIDFGTPAEKIEVIKQTINLERFRPPVSRAKFSGPLRVCYVGSLCLRKGFVYLLRAINTIGANRIALNVVGATGDRHSARLFDSERRGLAITAAPGDPVPAYHAAELFVLPTLEDGLPFVLVEAMAAGLPVIATNEAGASECIRPGRSGWVIPAGSVDSLAEALENAIRNRKDLAEMGVQARADVEQYASPGRVRELADFVSGLLSPDYR